MSEAAGPSRPALGRLWAFVVGVIVLGLVQAVAAALIASNDADPASNGLQLAVAAGVLLIGAATVSARTAFLRRPWRIDTATNLVADYAARLVVQLVLALGAANVAYAAAILTGAVWMVVLGLVFLLAPLSVAVPLERNLRATQAVLDERGCPFDLSAALRGRVGSV